MVDDLITDYLYEMALGKRPGTVRLRGYQLRDWQQWLAPHPLESAVRGDVVQYLQQWANPETRASRRDALAGFYRWARVVGAVPPAASPVELVSVGNRAQPDPHPIPDDVFAAAVAQAGPAQTRALILGRYAGLRASEIAAVHRGDLEVWPQHLRVDGKGGRVRYVPAHDQVRAVIEAAGGWVFPRRMDPGKHWTGGWISHLVSAALPGEWTCHSLRHAFATALYLQCGDWAIVQDSLGHASIDTSRRYVQVPRQRAVRAVRDLPVISPGGSSSCTDLGS